MKGRLTVYKLQELYCRIQEDLKIAQNIAHNIAQMMFMLSNCLPGFSVEEQEAEVAEVSALRSMAVSAVPPLVSDDDVPVPVGSRTLTVGLSSF